MGENVNWALDIAVTALVLVAFLPLVPDVLVLGPWRTRGRVRGRNPAGEAVRFLSMSPLGTTAIGNTSVLYSLS